MLTKPKPILVVTDVATSFIIPAKNQVIRVTTIGNAFPVIHELMPGIIVLDYEHMGMDTEKFLRRIKSNLFYSKIKLYCYKAQANTKVDGLLEALGVQQFIYADDVSKPKSNSIFKPAGIKINMFDPIGTLTEASY
jgi:CheY-like chemotaxis protein